MVSGFLPISFPSGPKLAVPSGVNPVAQSKRGQTRDARLRTFARLGRDCRKKFAKRKMCLPVRFECARKIVARPNAIRLD